MAALLWLFQKRQCPDLAGSCRSLFPKSLIKILLEKGLDEAATCLADGAIMRCVESRFEWLRDHGGYG